MDIVEITKADLITNLTGMLERFLDNLNPDVRIKASNAVMQDVFTNVSGYYRLTVDLLLELKPEENKGED